MGEKKLVLINCKGECTAGNGSGRRVLKELSRRRFLTETVIEALGEIELGTFHGFLLNIG